ncbi:MAG TPA: amidohydrolase family protein [Acidimicrobiales bacterium]
MYRSGLTVGLGSDNATLNCNSDSIDEMRRAVLTSRIAGAPHGDLTPSAAARMATIDGARAAGLDHLIGSLVPGKRPDVVVRDTSGPHWWPRHDWFDTLAIAVEAGTATAGNIR